MKIREDILRVMDELRKSVDANGNIDLAHILREVVLLFERVRIMLPETNAEERKEIYQSMAKMHTFLLGEIQRLSARTGISEPQLLMFAENPDNFTKEQWNLLVEVKSRMGKQAEEIRQIMHGFKETEGKLFNAPKKEGKERKKRVKKERVRA